MNGFARRAVAAAGGLCVVLMMAGPMLAQCPPGVVCPGGVCPVPQSQMVPINTEPVVMEAVLADSPHVRCMINGSCGSGTICGADANGAYVLTNAHVTGTQIGRQVMVDVIQGQGGKRTYGRTVMTGYSDSRMVDFSIVYVEGLSSKRYMPLLKTEPEHAPFATTGSPRCVWPLVTKAFNAPRNYGDGLLTGTPNAIGGQSGSAIYNSEGHQIALLTWSIGGRCAGQKTAKLWQVATERNVQLADPRPEGLEELADGDGESRPVTEEGVHGDCCGLVEMAADDAPTYAHIRPQTTDGLAYVVGSAMEDLPIWFVPGGDGDGPTDPDDPTDPDCDCDCEGCKKLTQAESDLIDFIRAQQTSFRDGQGREVAMDWVRLMGLIMELIRVIQEGRT